MSFKTDGNYFIESYCYNLPNLGQYPSGRVIDCRTLGSYKPLQVDSANEFTFYKQICLSIGFASRTINSSLRRICPIRKGSDKFSLSEIMESELNLSTILCNNSFGSYPCNDTLVEMEETKVPLYVVVPVLSLFCVVGTIGNATSFYIYFKRRDKSTSVIFILALAGTDFLTCLVIIPYTITFELLGYNLVYDVLCKLYLFLITSNIPFSAYIMTAIAFDRYFCICHPFFHAFTVRRAKIIVWCLACLACTFGVLTSLQYGMYYPTDVIVDSNGTIVDAVLLSRNMTDNATAIDPAPEVANVTTVLEFSQICFRSSLIIGGDAFNLYYQRIYTASFIVAFVIVVVLYCMIYRSILMRRAKKAKRKKKNNYTSVAVTDCGTPATVTTTTTTLNGNSATKPLQPKQKSKRPSTVKDTTLYANIKTALMLFVVTIVFVIAFLPAFLMTLDLIPFNMIVFYMYFSYNVANPIIYAFMNQTFREDLKNITKVCK
ncbi:hypothetical protein LOTGIDRAFT_160264 [Lottia gigantea]|uniref:G-protein coupled receptors family 1 profile domain-containing protein n=1 Tax=Lottia gigantea TaxID=225164 RepID=V4ALS9_LOTGI|nr:hypothetical protein LOTGIDRAFT_160264 [Lottia gigantea]ESO95715.1 hypothetical protein LOTGIDRAFT_160264 [Lottia gigantea]